MSFLTVIKIILLFVVSAIFIFAAGNVFQLKDRKNIDRNGALGLTLALLCWASVPLLVGLSSKIVLSPFFLITWNVVVWIAMVTAICLATTSLLDFSAIAQTTPSHSNKQARQTLFLAGFFLITMGFFAFQHDGGFLRNLFRKNPPQEDALEAKALFTETYVSDPFHFAVIGAGSGWEHWADLQDAIYRNAEFGVQYGESAYFVVIPYFAEEGMPEPDVFANAATPLLDLAPNEPWEGQWQRHQQDGFEGFVFDFEKKVQSATVAYKIKAVTNDKFGYLVAAWSDHEDPGRREVLLNNIHNRTKLTYDPESGALPVLEKFSQSIVRRHARINENIGYEYLKRKDYDRSVGFLKSAHKSQDQGSRILSSIVYAYMNQDNYESAKAYLEEYLDRYPEGKFLYEALSDMAEIDETVPEEIQQDLSERVMYELVEAFGEVPELKYYEGEWSHPEFDRDGEDFGARRRSRRGPAQRKAYRTTGHGAAPNPDLSSHDERKALEEHGVLYEKLNHTLYFEPGEPFESREKRRTRITKQKAATSFQYLYFPFDDKTEKIKVESVVVYDSTGQEVHKGNKKEYYVVEGAAEDKGKQVMNIPISELEVGGLIETDILWKSRRPIKSMPYFEYSFAAPYTTYLHELTLKGKIGAIRYKATQDIETTVGNNQIRWAYDHRLSEMPSSQASARIWIGDKSKRWETEARKLIKPINQILEKGTELIYQGRQLTKPVPKKLDKIRIVADYVKQTLTYNEKPFSAENLLRYNTYDFAEIEEADSLMHALYLLQLLKGIGIQSHPVFVRKDGVLQKDIPSLEQLDHALLYLPASKKVPFIDLTNKELPLGRLDKSLEGVEGLVLDPKKSYFERVAPVE